MKTAHTPGNVLHISRKQSPWADQTSSAATVNSSAQAGLYKCLYLQICLPSPSAPGSVQVSTVRDSAGKSQVPDKQQSQIMILLPHPIPICSSFLLCAGASRSGGRNSTGDWKQAQQLESVEVARPRQDTKTIHCKVSVMSGHMGSSWAFLGLEMEAAVIIVPWNLPGMGIKRCLQWEGRDKNRGEEKRSRGGSTLILHNLLEKNIMPY